MKKYIVTIKTAWKNFLAYKFDIYGSAVLSIFTILLSFIMWKAIFGGKTEVSGFTFKMMVTYYIIVTMLTRLDVSQDISSSIAEEIRTGNFTKYLIKPFSVFGYYISSVFAKFSYVLCINLLATTIWALIFNNYFILPSSISNLLLAVMCALLGLLFLSCLNYLFLILTFWVLDVTAFFMIKDQIIAFVSGALIPLNFLPIGVQSVFKFLPFYYVFYYPATLYLGIEEVSFLQAMTVLLGWCSALFIINYYLYKKAKKHYEGVGI